MGIDYKVVVKSTSLPGYLLPPPRSSQHNAAIHVCTTARGTRIHYKWQLTWFLILSFYIKILRLDWGGTCSTKCCLLWLVQLLQLATTYNYSRYLSSTFKRPVFHPSLSINVRYRMESIQRAIDTNPQSKVPKRAFPYQLVVIIQLVANESWFGSKTILGNC